MGFALRLLLFLHSGGQRRSMRGQNATLVNGFNCLGRPWVLMPSYYAHLPQQASQECFLQGGSCTHCHSSQSRGEAAAGRAMPTSGMASGPVPEAWATLLPKRIRVSQVAETAMEPVHELDGQEPVTENSSKPAAAPGCAELSSLLHSSCVFSGKTWVLTQFFSLWVNDGSSLSLSHHL